MKKITFIFAGLMLTAAILNLNARSASVTKYTPIMPDITIPMGPYGESLIDVFPYSKEYTFANSEPINIKLQCYVTGTDFLRGLLGLPVPKQVKGFSSTQKIKAITSESFSQYMEEQQTQSEIKAKSVEFSVSDCSVSLDAGAEEDRINQISEWIDNEGILPVWESEVQSFASSNCNASNKATFEWIPIANLAGLDNFIDDGTVYVLRNADTDEILHVRTNYDFYLKDAYKSGKSETTANGVITSSYYFAANMPVRVHFFLLSDSYCAEFMDIKNFNEGFNGMYDYYLNECWNNSIVAYKRDVVIANPFEFTEVTWDLFSPDGSPLSGGRTLYRVTIWEALDERKGMQPSPSIGSGMNLGMIWLGEVTLPEVEGAYTGAIRPYDVNGYLDEQCGVYPQYCSGVVETRHATSLQVVGYYSILGQKLPKEPENGFYIIKYENGKAEKILK